LPQSAIVKTAGHKPIKNGRPLRGGQYAFRREEDRAEKSKICNITVLHRNG
jgi:hypothetical protein